MLTYFSGFLRGSSDEISNTSSNVFMASSFSLLALEADGVTLELAFTGALNLPKLCFILLVLLVVFFSLSWALLALIGFTLLPSRTISDGDAIKKMNKNTEESLEVINMS
jgi:hypothetical protein